MKDNINKIKKMDLDYTFGKMEVNIKANLKVI